MLGFPHESHSTRQEELIERILALSFVLEKMPVSEEGKERLWQRHVLKSSLFSARIEGNKINLEEIIRGGGKLKERLEVENVMGVLKNLEKFGGAMTLDKLVQIHEEIMKGIDGGNLGFRNEQTAIFDVGGNAVYVTPAPETMKVMLREWLSEYNKKRTVREWLGILPRLHYYFEKIHPFVDGNGRTGRVLLHLGLKEAGMGKGGVAIDEYLEMRKEEYYLGLENNTKDIGSFCEFMLEGIVWGTENWITEMGKDGEGNKDVIVLLPRRQEIVSIVREHPYISMDGLKRRFLGVPARTLGYDCNWLVKQGFLIKMGTTKGVCYTAK